MELPSAFPWSKQNIIHRFFFPVRLRPKLRYPPHSLQLVTGRRRDGIEDGSETEDVQEGPVALLVPDTLLSYKT